MTTAKQFQHIIVYTTPAELRKAADYLEQQWKAASAIDLLPDVRFKMAETDGLTVTLKATL